MKTDRTSGLASLRTANGQKASLTARLMGVSGPAVSRIESGAHRPRASTLMAYYAAVGRHDLIALVGLAPGQQIDSGTLDAAMRWSARFGDPRKPHEAVTSRLSGRLERVRNQAARGVADRKRLLEELDDLAYEREADVPGPLLDTCVPDTASQVSRFFADACVVVPSVYGATALSHESTGRRELARMFNEWSAARGGRALGERTFFRLAAEVPGVVVVMRATTRARAFNVRVAVGQG